MTTPTEPPNDPWENAPRMSPEQAPPPGPWGAPPQGPPPPGQWGPPPQGPPPPGPWGAPPPPPGYAPPPPPGQWGAQPAYGQHPGYGYAPYPNQPKNGLGIGALVLGIVGIFLTVAVVGGLLGIAAVVMGIVGMGRVKRGEASNNGVCVGGIVTGALAVVGSLVFLVAYISIGDEIGSYAECVGQAETQQELDECEADFRDRLEQ